MPAVARVQWYLGIIGTAVYDVTVSSIDCYAGTVSLSVTGFPVGYRRHYFDPGDIVTVPSLGSATVQLVVEVTSRPLVGDYVLTILGNDGSVTHSCNVTMEVRRPSRRGGALKLGVGMPEEYILEQNYPNPFNPVTSIEFGLPEDAKVTVTVYNILGQVVTELVNGEMEAGYHVVRWNGENAASGVYFYRIQANDFMRTKWMVLMK